MATTTASTKRSPAAVDGKIGEMETNLTGLSIVPLMPVDPDTVQDLPLRSPREAKQTFVEGLLDIVEGDRLVVDSTEYVIRSAAEWDGARGDFLHLVVEELKAS
jgi:hypothetical protein